jgi:N-acetylmuramoyl-L-alanine amidase
MLKGNRVAPGSQSNPLNYTKYSSKILKELLEDKKATVVMTRETHDINISNVERQ